LTSLPKAEDTAATGWYVIVLTDKNGWIKLYVEQARNLRNRDHQHRLSYRRNGHLVHRLWNKPWREAHIHALGTTNHVDNEYLNLVEQFWAVALQTLQPVRLAEWLPAHVYRTRTPAQAWRCRPGRYRRDSRG
jgi:hypothetical protein